MIFNSVSYISFLVIAVVAYWLLPKAGRIWLLLAASLLFYGLWRPEFVLLITFSAFIDYFFSLRIHAAVSAAWRRAYMIASVSINVALLIYFKYTYFLVDNAAALFGMSAPPARVWLGAIVLPLGISFYTFLSISYTIDVYRREFTPIGNFGRYLTYVMFWPHMIAGPILRAHELIPQLEAPASLRTDKAIEAFKAILFGLFLKVGLADNLAPLIDEAFTVSPAALGGLDVLTMGFGFGLQIYFDFAGYSMIAVGSAGLLGIAFPRNFNWPYLASSPRDFWKRWHITLSSWIRDYLYLPLSGLREHGHASSGGIDIQFERNRAFIRTTLALFVTWFIMGLWHGASWNFALWGLWHAAFILAYRLIAPRLPVGATPVGRFVGWGLTLLIAMVGWIPFRSPDVATTIALWSRLLDPAGYRSLGLRENSYLVVALFFVGMIGLYWLKRIRLPGWVGVAVRETGQTLAMAACLFIVFIFLRPISQFIYFQF